MARRSGSIPRRGSQLVVCLYPEADPRPVEEVAKAEQGQCHLLFSRTAERLIFEANDCERQCGVRPPDLTRYFRVRVPVARMQDVAERLRQSKAVEGAYITPAVALPTPHKLKPKKAKPPVPTPPFTDRQGYLDKAPGGVDARFAWGIGTGGGRGSGVKIIHIEGAWDFGHEDLAQNFGGVKGTQQSASHWRQHGTAVLGVLGGDVGNAGVTGVAPGAALQAIAVGTLDDPEGPEVGTAIRQAANALRPGDIILLELQHPGPRVGFEESDNRAGYIMPEWWPETFAALKYANSRGVIVVEAAGNGGEDLDHSDFDAPDVGFPKSWKNPFGRRNGVDSGAIVVGAGAPPPGTHGRDIHGPDRSRLVFSNYGSMLDVQAWGKEVTTCGYGSLQGGPSEKRWYTDEFGGTSSAAPIVAGVLACVQGILRERGVSPLTPAQARQLLHETGSPQQDAQGRPATERIGNRPDLREIISRLKLMGPA
ncbi:MAG TPA: S8 family serine peptidase [Methylomirabilota bacterium]|jgi:subtilisin family serine protease